MFDRFYITAKGKALLAKTQAGQLINFTKVSVGKGSLPSDTDVTTVAALISKVKDLPVANVTSSGDTSSIKAQFSNTGITTQFYWREIGLYSQDPDEGEILYAYGNAGDNADLIPAYSVSPTEFLFTMVLVFSNSGVAATATINDNLIYVSKQELQASISDLRQYTNAQCNGKVDKISGMGLSENNYSNAERTKLINATTDIDNLKSQKADLINGKVPVTQINPSPYVATTTGSGSAYIAQINGLTSLTKGLEVTIIPHVTSITTAPTLNLNGLGAKTIYRLQGYSGGQTAGYIASWLPSGQPQKMMYNGTYWIALNREKSYASDITGTIAVTNGGTGKGSWNTNRIIYPSSASALTQMVYPTYSGSFLRQNTSGAPFWSSPSVIAADIGAIKSISIDGVVQDIKSGQSVEINNEVLGAQPKTAARNVIIKANATGDLVSATYGADYSDAPRPNLLINSDFRVHQRGERFINLCDNDTGVYTADRWMVYCLPTYNSYLDVECQDSGSLKINNTRVSASYCYLRYYLEYADACALRGRKVLVSYKMTTSSGSSILYEVKDIPAKIEDGSSYLLINRQFSIAAASTITINWVKAEVVDAAVTTSNAAQYATPYVPRPLTQELAACYRYYWTIPTIHIPQGYFDQIRANFEYYFPIIMRIAPTESHTELAVFKQSTSMVMSGGSASIGQTTVHRAIWYGSGFTSDGLLRVTKPAFDSEIYS